MKTAMIILGASLIFCVMLPGCKEKSEEEEIDQLVEKMGQAKTEEEAAKIADKIERLEESANKITREVSVRLGQPFTFWQPIDRTSHDMTQFSMTFENVAVTGETILGEKEAGKKYLMILAKTKNLGPRKTWDPPSSDDIQVKTEKGNLYRTYGYPALDFFSSQPPFPLDWETLDKWRSPFGVFKTSLEPEEIGWIIYWTSIPEDNTPVEVFGQFPTEPVLHGGKKRTDFRLKLTQFEKISFERKEETKPVFLAQEKDLKKNISGKYSVPTGIFMEILSEKGAGFGKKYLEFKNDGSLLFSESGSDRTWQGKWEIVPLVRFSWSTPDGEILSCEGEIKKDSLLMGRQILKLRDFSWVYLGVSGEDEVWTEVWTKEEDAQLINQIDHTHHVWTEYTHQEFSFNQTWRRDCPIRS